MQRSSGFGVTQRIFRERELCAVYPEVSPFRPFDTIAVLSFGWLCAGEGGLGGVVHWVGCVFVVSA
eukprot:6211421-Pleurochrysis_carterae.AAC.4